MIVNTVRNVNEALAEGLELLSSPGSTGREMSRNGAVISATVPVTTVTLKSMERVLFSPYRNANPFFHLFESLWMLAGRNDLPWLTQFNKQMGAYSDDGGETQPAAYGYRWRCYFGLDQLDLIASELTERPNSRRAVLAMWDGGSYRDENPGGDLGRAYDGSKDVPCNTHCYFRIDEAGLHMMVACRSNDAVWGAHGANAVHFSVLLEYLAARLGVPVGAMTQVSWNYHLYEGVLKYSPEVVAADARTNDHYSEGTVTATPMFDELRASPTRFDADREIRVFCDFAAPGVIRAGIPGIGGFLRTTALPMLQAWHLYKSDDMDGAIGATFDIKGSDWELACRQWLQRIRTRREAK